MLNSASIMGRLTKAPELNQTSTGMYYTRFCVACSNKTAKGEETTDFIDCLAWTKTAEFINRWFQQGDLIAITGRITTRNYERRDGSKAKSTEVVVNTADFCGGTSRKNDQHSTPKPAPLTPPPVADDSALLPFDLGDGFDIQ